ncbi:MAG: putative O-glycosylation ligase, exosortase A system-associated, partial [Novosphingobium sp.]
MRDIALFAFVFGMLPFILKQPYIGVLAWSWLSYMNPHRLTWGPAYDFPFAQLVAVTLFVSLVLNPEKQRFPASRIVVVWVLFLLWTLVSTYFAYFPHSAWEYETRVFKIQIILFISLWLMGSPERIKLMVWVIFVSVGFFGIKGGIFTILTGGSGRVYGPAASFIAENNALAVALLMVIVITSAAVSPPAP